LTKKMQAKSDINLKFNNKKVLIIEMMTNIMIFMGLLYIKEVQDHTDITTLTAEDLNLQTLGINAMTVR
jgi:hypothetical protein